MIAQLARVVACAVDQCGFTAAKELQAHDVEPSADNAALVTWGDLLIATTTEGELVVVRAGRKAFDVIRRYTVADSPVWAHPVPAGSGVLIKDEDTLAYYTF